MYNVENMVIKNNPEISLPVFKHFQTIDVGYIIRFITKAKGS